MIQKSRGFTIVELLIVIVVIAILAAISMAVYGNISAKARDNVRKQDMATIKKALLAYDVEHGGVRATTRLPRYNPTTSTRGGWDASVDAGWLSFLRADYGEMPRDPVNAMDSATNDPNIGSLHRVYSYYCYENSGDPYVRFNYNSENGTRGGLQFSVSSCSVD